MTGQRKIGKRVQFADKLTNWQYSWINNVVQGQDYLKALGSYCKTLRARQGRAAEMLGNPSVVSALVARLLMDGQADKAKEVLSYRAAIQAATLIDKGDGRTISALMPQGKRRAVAPPASPPAEDMDAPRRLVPSADKEH